MPENTTGVIESGFKQKGAEQPISPDERLNQSVKDMATFLGISAASLEHLSANLPLRLSNQRPPMAIGSFRATKEGDKSVGEISFESDEVLSSDALIHRRTRDEEATHYLHSAYNPGLVRKLVEQEENEKQQEEDHARNIDESTTVLEKTVAYASNNLSLFAARTNLTLPETPTTEEDIMAAVKYSLGELDQWGEWEQTRLSVGQMARINTAINQLDPSQTDEMFTYYDFADYEVDLKASRSAFKQGDQRRQKDAAERMRGTSGYLASRLREKIKTMEPKTVAKAYEMALVDLDRVGYRQQKLEKDIKNMSLSQTQASLSTFLEQECSYHELIIIAYLTSKWIEHRVLLDKQGDAAKDSVRQSLIEDLKQPLDRPESRAHWALLDLMHQSQRAATAQGLLEKRLLFFLGDLPADETARARLLANPIFVKQNEEAVLKSLQDPNMDMLGGNDFNPQAFAADQPTSRQATRKALSQSIQNSEVAAFIADLDSETEHKRRMGFMPDVLEVDSARHIDRILADKGYALGQIPEASDWQDANLQAFAESTEYLRKKQELALQRHENDLISEPIAKVIVAQKNNQALEDIEFPENMGFGYTSLLRTQDARGWLKDLWEFVAHTRSTSGGTNRMLEFFKAKDIKQQQAIVGV